MTVELRKRRANGCRYRNYVTAFDSPYTVCAVCSHRHDPWSPYCPICAIDGLRAALAEFVLLARRT